MTATQQPTPQPGQQPGQPGQQLWGQQTVTRQAVIQQPAVPPQPPGQHAAPGQSPRRGSLRAAGARLAGSGGGTPATLRFLLTGLVAASLVWGAVAAWTVNQHASAATQVVSASEPLTLAAKGMYQSLSDADVTETSAFMQVASEVMHLRLLPAANSLYAQETAALGSVSGQATSLPWIIVALVLAAAIGFALLRTQRWLHRRTHRRVNYGLAWATVAVIVMFAWLAIAFTSARSDLENGLQHGSTPAEELAQASISAQQARGDEILNLISRTGSTSFQADFIARRAKIGPGPGTLLTTAAAASPSGQGANEAAAAERAALNWYTAAGRVFGLDVAANYAAETTLVLDKQQGTSYAQFGKLEADLRQAIAADQVTFRSSATAGSDAFSGLELGVILAALVMMAGSVWGLSRRLAEYR